MVMDESTVSFDTFSRSEEHTSELQSQSNLVCRLLLEKKKQRQNYMPLFPPRRTIHGAGSHRICIPSCRLAYSSYKRLSIPVDARQSSLVVCQFYHTR